MKWKNLKLGVKIIIGFSMVSLVALIIGLISFISLNQVGKSFNEVAEVRLPSIQSLLEMEYGFEKLRVAHRSLLIPDLTSQDKERQMENINDARELYQNAWSIYEPLPQTEEEAKLWKEFVSKTAEWRSLNENFEKLIKESHDLGIDNPYDVLQKLTLFMYDHYALQLKILDAIHHHEVFEGGDDHNQCRFGQWRNSVQINNESIKKELSDIDKSHKAFHQSVKDIKDFIKQGRINEAYNYYNSIMEEASNQTFHHFNNISSIAEHAVELVKKAESENMNVARVKQAEVLSLLDKIIDINKEVSDKAILDGKQTTSRSNMMVLLVIVIGLVISFSLGIIISRLITRPIVKGVKFAQEVSNGNLAAIVDVDQNDEVGQLAKALQNMVRKLKDIVVNIRSGADNIAAASMQMSSSSQEMSQGATEQASSAEEVSSSMEEMVSNIQQNTDNAQQTEKIAIKAAEGIREGNKSTEVSVSAMKEIASKINIINDIAFQTNILALNAAVEAARAGEHGKGFAMVAAEVRKLAERSKVAADEIDLLSKNGVAVAEKAGTQLNEIVPEIERTAKLVQEIAAASIEQNSGADQVNGAIQQLNQVTQQNAAAAEEMATSSEELSSQAEQLKELISFFKIGEEATRSFSSHSSHTAKTKVAHLENKKQKSGLKEFVATPKKQAVKQEKHDGVVIDLDGKAAADADYENF